MQQRSRSRSSSTASDRNGDALVEPSKRLFICGLAIDVDEGELRSLFEDCGEVADFYLKRQESGSILCFVEMSTQNEADNAISSLNGKRIAGRMMWVKYAKPKPQGGNRKEGNGGNAGSKPSYGGQQRDQQGRGDGFKRNDGGQYQGRNNEGQRDFRGKFGQGREEERGQGRGNNNFRGSGNSDRGYQGGKESSGYGRNEGGRGGERSSKPEVTENLDY